jgi:hypothetical protein
MEAERLQIMSRKRFEAETMLYQNDGKTGSWESVG